MSSFTAELRVTGHRYPVVQFHMAFTQATQRGRVNAKVNHGRLELELDVPHQDHLLAWAAEAHKALPGTLVIFDAVGQPTEYVSFATGYCVTYHEVFEAGDAQRGAYRCTLHLTDPSGFTMGAGAAPAEFKAPPAREHGLPPQPLVSTPTAALPAGPVSTCPPAETARLQAQVELLCKSGKSKCIDTDTCPTLTGKMAALQACITARETIMNRCFGGGDAGHQNEVQQRKNGLRRCAAIYQRQCTPRPSPAPVPVPRRVPSTEPVPEPPSPVVPTTVLGAAALILYILSSALRPGPI